MITWLTRVYVGYIYIHLHDIDGVLVANLPLGVTEACMIFFAMLLIRKDWSNHQAVADVSPHVFQFVA